MIVDTTACHTRWAFSLQKDGFTLFGIALGVTLDPKDVNSKNIVFTISIFQ